MQNVPLNNDPTPTSPHGNTLRRCLSGDLSNCPNEDWWIRFQPSNKGVAGLILLTQKLLLLLLHLLHLPLYCNDLRHSLWHSAWPFTTERKQPLTLNNLPLPHTRVHTHSLKGYHRVLGSRASSIDGSKTKGNKLLCLCGSDKLEESWEFQRKTNVFLSAFHPVFRYINLVRLSSAKSTVVLRNAAWILIDSQWKQHSTE